MPVIEKSINVRYPIGSVYNQWTQFETFPEFMEGVDEVVRLDDTHLRWRAELAGANREWESEINRRIPEKCIAWKSTTGPRNDGVVLFEPLDAANTRVTLIVDYDPKGLRKRIGSVFGVVSRRIQGDMERFRDFLETRPAATGEWHGHVSRDEVLPR